MLMGRREGIDTKPGCRADVELVLQGQIRLLPHWPSTGRQSARLCAPQEVCADLACAFRFDSNPYQGVSMQEQFHLTIDDGVGAPDLR